MDCSPGWPAFLKEGASMPLRLSDVAGNLIAYALLAACLSARSARSRRNALRTLVFCCILSLGIEALQTCLPSRLSSGWDWLFNGLGALLGTVGAHLLDGRRASFLRSLASRGDARMCMNPGVVLITTLAWATFASSPWTLSDPALAPDKWLGLWTTWGLSGLEHSRLVSALLQGLSVGLLLGLAHPRGSFALVSALTLTLGVLTSELMMMRSAPMVELWVGLPSAMLCGLLAGRLVGGSRWTEKPVARRLAGAALAALTCLALFWWSTRANPGGIRPLAWTLRGLEGDALEGIRLLGLVTWVAMSLCLAGVLIGGPRGLWALVALLVLGGSEVLQSMTPGRTADLTAPVFGLAGVLLADLMGPKQASGLQSRATVAPAESDA